MSQANLQSIMESFLLEIKGVTDKAILAMQQVAEPVIEEPKLITSVMPATVVQTQPHTPRIVTAKLEGGGKVTAVHSAAAHKKDPHEKGWEESRRFLELIKEAKGDVMLATRKYVYEVMIVKLEDREKVRSWAAETVAKVKPGATLPTELIRVDPETDETSPDVLALLELRMSADRFEVPKSAEAVDTLVSEDVSEDKTFDQQISEIFDEFIALEQDGAASEVMTQFDYDSYSSTVNKSRTLEALKTLFEQIKVRAS